MTTIIVITLTILVIYSLAYQLNRTLKEIKELITRIKDIENKLNKL